MRMQQQPLLGILGGMGPLATVDFLDKLTRLTPARRDQDHMPWMTLSQPGMPDRSQAIRNGDDGPLPWLVDGVNWLAGQGAQLIVIPCNTSHYWYDRVQAACPVPIVHIADAALVELRAMLPQHAGPVAVLGTRGMIQAGIYDSRLAAAGYAMATLSDAEQAMVDKVIAAVKGGMVSIARDEMRELEGLLRKKGARLVILACTELPLAYEKRSDIALPAIDSSLALAREALRRLGYLKTF